MSEERFKLRAYVAPRDRDRFPEADESLGRALISTVHQALEKGTPRPGFFAFRGDEMDRFDLGPLMRAPRRRRDLFLAAIAGRSDIECVALLGVLRVGGSGARPKARSAVVYLEWPNNRWWTAWTPLGAEKNELTIRSAMDGWPRPGGVGGWFSLHRRTGVRLRVHPTSGQVH